MRHIFHTCLLAMRLISSVDSVNADSKQLSVFDNSWINEAYSWFYVKPNLDNKKTYQVLNFFVPQTAA